MVISSNSGHADKKQYSAVLSVIQYGAAVVMFVSIIIMGGIASPSNNFEWDKLFLESYQWQKQPTNNGYLRHDRSTIQPMSCHYFFTAAKFDAAEPNIDDPIPSQESGSQDGYLQLIYKEGHRHTAKVGPVRNLMYDMRIKAGHGDFFLT